VGTSGARVEQAMGNSTPHPDEPEPWVYTILPEHLEGDAAPLNGRHAATAPIGRPREARPVEVPGMAATAVDEDPAADALLRELHSLSALDELADERETADEQPAPSPATQVPDPTPEPAARPAPLPRPDSASIADAFAELSALDSPGEPARPAPAPAPSRSSTPPPPTTTPAPTGPDAAPEDDFSSLFGDLVEPASPPPTATPSAGDTHPGQPGTPPAPEGDRGALRAVPSSPPAPSVPPDSPSDSPTGSAGEEPAADPTPAPPPTPAPAASLDLSNFTAKGGAAGRNGRGKGRWSRR